MNRPPLPFANRALDSHKGDFGRVLLIGGSRGMAGSISLSAIAALKTGSGLVSAAVPDVCLETVAGFHPGVMTIPMDGTVKGCFSNSACLEISKHCDGKNAIGIGPGMTCHPGSIALVDRIISLKSIPRVFDADAINIIASEDLMANVSDLGPIVLTPHPGELSRLTGIPTNDRDGQINAARHLAQSVGIVIVVKGAPTVVVSPGDENTTTWTNTTGNPGMATGGSGDVLTGIITSLLGQGYTITDAARLGVWIHGRAGDLAAKKHGQAGMTCWEILQEIPMAIG